MMYRVFLRDGKDVPSYTRSKDNVPAYMISAGEILAWYNKCPPDFKPDLESQLQRCHVEDEIRASLELIGEHILIQVDRQTYGVEHFSPEISRERTLELAKQKSYDKAYDFARQKAIQIKDRLTKEKGYHYIFIDVTSRANMGEARKQAEEIYHVSIPDSNWAIPEGW